MLYTVGTRTSYDPNVGKRDFRKLGRGTLKDGTPYGGGIVFLSMGEAQAYLEVRGFEKDWGVYGLLTTRANTYRHPDGTRRLRRSCRIVAAQPQET